MIVVRRDLFKPSEGFITDQARSHDRWEPVFVGVPGRRPPPAWAHVVPLSELRSLDAMRTERVPCVVHAHFGPDGILGMRIAKRLHVPLVVTLHGFDVTRSRASMLRSGRPHLVAYAVRCNELFRSSAAFLAVSGFIREQSLDWGIPEEKVRVHHIGIPMAPEHSSEDAERHGRGPALQIAHVARLVEKKGTAVLLQALALFRDRGCVADLQIVGAGPERAALETLSARLGVAGRVSFLGALPRSQTLEVIARSDALCVPSQRAANGDAEGLPTVLLEAARAGVPIVATRSGGISDFVDPGVTGLLSEERDAQELASNLARLHDDPGPLRAGLRAGARRKLSADFDIAKNTADLESLFEELSCA